MRESLRSPQLSLHEPALSSGKAARRRISASEKAQILEAFQGARTPKERTAVLHQYQISRAQVRAWQEKVERSGLSGLERRKPGPIPRRDAEDRAIFQLTQKARQLSNDLATAMALVELQRLAYTLVHANQKSRGPESF